MQHSSWQPQIEDYSLVRFIPLNPTDEESIGDLLLSIDTTLQFDEDQDVRIPRDVDEDDDGDREAWRCLVYERTITKDWD